MDYWGFEREPDERLMHRKMKSPKPRYQIVRINIQITDLRGVTDEWIDKRRRQISKLLKGKSQERKIFIEL